MVTMPFSLLNQEITPVSREERSLVILCNFNLLAKLFLGEVGELIKMMQS